MKLIDKDALLAKIWKRRDKHFHFGGSPASEYCHEDDEIIAIINTLEVKEVDYAPIDNDFERDAVNFCFDNGLNTTPRIAKTIAKHFFELGLKVKDK